MENRIIVTSGAEKDYLLNADTPDARQTLELNTQSTLEFSIRRSNPKARYFDRADVLAEYDGRVYCLIDEKGPEDVLDNTAANENSTLISVVMKELHHKLKYRFITAYNVDLEESSEFDHIDTHMVVLLGASPDQLVINGEQVSAPYPVGTAKWFFWCLLYGTGWTLDARYDAYWPDGAFDLETDKKTILENIDVLQSLFGGFLLWDSKGKRVALVDEDKYQVDDGFDVRFGRQKGVLMKARTRRENREIYTKLYVFGNDDLNIADVNDDREYLEDYSYTQEVLEGVVRHNDIYQQETLLAWGQKQIARLCKPRFTYEITLLDKRKDGAPQAVGPEIAKMCTVHDPKQPGGKAVLRVTAIDRSAFNEWDVEIEVGDVRDKFPQVLKDIMQAEEKVSDTVSNNNQVAGGSIRGPTPALTASNLHWGSVTGGLQAGISSLEVKTDNIQLEVNDNKGNIAGLYVSVGQVEARVSDTEGNIASLTVRADQIQSTVTNSVDNLQSQITQAANRISAIVSADGVVKAAVILSAVNSSSSALIKADRITFDGYTMTGNIGISGNLNFNLSSRVYLPQQVYFAGMQIVRNSAGYLTC